MHVCNVSLCDLYSTGCDSAIEEIHRCPEEVALCDIQGEIQILYICRVVFDVFKLSFKSTTVNYDAVNIDQARGPHLSRDGDVQGSSEGCWRVVQRERNAFFLQRFSACRQAALC